MHALTQDKGEPLRMTETEYLEFEATSANKHEFVNGKVYAMTGASWTHSVICGNTSSSLDSQILESDCVVVSNDIRLKVDSKVAYRYPDVMVVCGEPQFVDKRVETIRNPIVIIEVLSPSTELIDRNEKLDEYMRLDSVQEYLLIAQDEAKIERYLRQESGEWLYKKVVGIEQYIDLPSIACRLDLATVYKKLSLKRDSGD